MILFLKALLGALAVLLIDFFSRQKEHYYIAGLIPLFPTFALIAHYLVGTQKTTLELKQTVLFSMFSLLPYFVYLFSLYFFIDRFRLITTLILSVICWIGSASILIFSWQKYNS